MHVRVCFHTCRLIALFLNRDYDYYNVAFYSWCGSLSHGKVSKRTKIVNTSHVRVNCLIGQSSTEHDSFINRCNLSLSLSLSLALTHSFTHSLTHSLTLSLTHSLTHTHTHTHAHAHSHSHSHSHSHTHSHTSGWNVNSFECLLLLFFVAVDIFINLSFWAGVQCCVPIHIYPF